MLKIPLKEVRFLLVLMVLTLLVAIRLIATKLMSLKLVPNKIGHPCLVEPRWEELRLIVTKRKKPNSQMIIILLCHIHHNRIMEIIKMCSKVNITLASWIWISSWVKLNEKEHKHIINKCKLKLSKGLVNFAINKSQMKRQKIIIWQCSRPVIAFIKYILIVWKIQPLNNFQKIIMFRVQIAKRWSISMK